MVHQLRLRTPDAEGLGLIPGQGTRSHMLQLRDCMPQLKKSQVPQLRPSTAQEIFLKREVPKK